MNGDIRQDRFKSKFIKERVWVELMWKKMVETCSRWFEHVWRTGLPEIYRLGQKLCKILKKDIRVW